MVEPSPAWRFGNWLLEPAERRLSHDGTVVAIEPRAFDLLMVLVEHPERLITKDELLAQVWPDVQVADNALTRAVTRLRRVLGDDARSPRWIETVHGSGYRFLGPVESVAPGGRGAKPAAPRGPRAAFADPLSASDRSELSKARLGWGARVTLIGSLIALLAVVAGTGRLPMRPSPPEAMPGTVWRIAQVEGKHAPAEAARAEAMRHYRRGRAWYQQQTQIGNEQAIESYRLALAADPDLALAHAGLANAYLMRTVRYGFDEEPWRSEAAEAVRWALEIDPDLPEAHKAQGLLHDVDGRPDDALRSYRRSLELAPDQAEAAYNAASTAFALGRWDEAIGFQSRDLDRPAGRAAMAILLFEIGRPSAGRQLADEVLGEDPLTGYLISYLALRTILDGNLAAGRDQARRLVEAYPLWWRPRWVLGEILWRLGDRPGATAALERSVELAGEDVTEATVSLAAVLMVRGETTRGEALMVDVEQNALRSIAAGRATHVDHFRLATAASLRGRPEAALDHLEAAIKAGRQTAAWDRVHVAFMPLRDEPRFARLLARMEQEVARERGLVDQEELIPASIWSSDRQ
ncbi:MAG: winged helix-turn-helix domain-containing protein [Acidobacteriota bacterium]